MGLGKKTKHVFETGDLVLLMPLALPVLILQEVKQEDTFAKVLWEHQTVYVETFRLASKEVKDENC